jgi:uncharacterized protein (TIGR02246 family)
MFKLRRVGPTVAFLTLVACGQQAPAPDTRADEAAIRAASMEWAAAARAKNVDAFVAFYADDAVLFLEAAPDVSGKPAIREAIGGMMQDQNFALSLTTANVVVAGSGDVAYETGRYALTMSDANNNNAPVTQSGAFVVIWRKQADNSWKAVVDAPISDPSPLTHSPRA